MPFGNSRGQGFNNPVISKFQAGSIYMDSTGLYVYDGTPGLGVPLVTSDSDSSVDPFGNPIAPGVVVYTSPTQAIQIADGFITYMVYSGGSWSAECTLSLGAGGFSIQTNGGAGTLNADNNGCLEMTTGQDSETYRLGHKAFSATNVAVSSTGFATVLSIPGLGASGYGYHLKGYAIYHRSTAAGSPQFSWGESGGLR